MSEVKMSDVYSNLPWREDGNVSFLYVEPIQNIMIAKAVNNHDRLQQENSELREFVTNLSNSPIHAKLGTKGHNGYEEHLSADWKEGAKELLAKLLSKND